MLGHSQPSGPDCWISFRISREISRPDTQRPSNSIQRAVLIFLQIAEPALRPPDSYHPTTDAQTRAPPARANGWLSPCSLQPYPDDNGESGVTEHPPTSLASPGGEWIDVQLPSAHCAERIESRSWTEQHPEACRHRGEAEPAPPGLPQADPDAGLANPVSRGKASPGPE